MVESSPEPARTGNAVPRTVPQSRAPRRRWVTSPISPKSGNSLRATVTLLLVVSVIAVVIYSIIAGLPAEEMASYLAPLSGLAGLALGYWFGSEK
jgi:hypothetical protein